MLDSGGLYHPDHPVSSWEAEYRAATLALGDYVNKNRFPGVVLGLSGGIDSALVATIAADAIGPGNLRCVMLPSRYTSPASLEDAAAVARVDGDSGAVDAEADGASADGADDGAAEGAEDGVCDSDVAVEAGKLTEAVVSHEAGKVLIEDGLKNVFHIDEGFEDLAVVFPADGTGYEIGAQALIANAPHPNNAKTWIDWALQADTQSIGPSVEAYQLPTNPEAEVSEFAVDISQVNLVDYDFQAAGEFVASRSTPRLAFQVSSPILPLKAPLSVSLEPASR